MTDHIARRLALAPAHDFGRGAAGARRRAAISAYLRQVLTQVWAEATQGSREPTLALAAVGSLARAETGPLSDLDLVLLHTGRARSEAIEEIANRLWYPLWDNGIRLDHSVRTVKECRAIAASDLTAAVGLLDLSHVAGDLETVHAARSALAHDWRANARTRLPQLLESVAVRHARAGDVAHAIEPDLKEAHGGLRDLTILAALQQAWLTDRPRGSIEAARATLLDVRDAVQVVTARPRDRLGQPDQDAVAALLGLSSADDLLTEVATAGRTIAYALDGAVRRAGQSARARTLRVGPRRPTMKPLGFGLFESDGEVVLGAANRAEQDAMLPMRAAIVAARQGLPIAPVTLANLAEHAPALPEPWPALARELFGELLSSGPGLVSVWEGLDQAGIIDRWLPEWAAVRSRPQRNAVHRHTVDRHLIETALQASSLVREVARPDLLLLAALLHDIGKVPGAHDHSVEGAPIARRIASRLGFADGDVAVVESAVAEHLTLIELATRRDVSDPQTIARAREAVGDTRDGLDLLLALTQADAVAAGPKAWTPWRAALMTQLGDAVRAALDDGSAGRRDDAGAVAQECDPDIVSAVAAGEPVVVVTPHAGLHRVAVHDRDRPGLFADVAGLFAAQRFSVRTAQLGTVDDVASDVWLVESPDGRAPDPYAIAHGLRLLARGDQTPLASLARRAAAANVAPAVVGAGATRAYVVPQASTGATVLEVRAGDAPGLLHRLGRTMAELGLSVRSAHIATHAGQALDTFYVTKAGGPLSPADVAQAVAALIDA